MYIKGNGTILSSLIGSMEGHDHSSPGLIPSYRSIKTELVSVFRQLIMCWNETLKQHWHVVNVIFKYLFVSLMISDLMVFKADNKGVKVRICQI